MTWTLLWHCSLTLTNSCSLSLFKTKPNPWLLEKWQWYFVSCLRSSRTCKPLVEVLMVLKKKKRMVYNNFPNHFVQCPLSFVPFRVAMTCRLTSFRKLCNCFDKWNVSHHHWICFTMQSKNLVRNKVHM